MITEDTVFILGAGASKPYGYPTAKELRKQIIYDFIPLYKENFQESVSPGVIRLMEEFIRHFDLSGTESIDLFLTRNKKFKDIGKQVIAFLLAHAEVNSRYREKIENIQHDWYTLLLKKLTDEILNPEDLDKFLENKLRILTFNYDRSLDNFLYESLYHSFLTKQSDVKRIIAEFKIIHIYGRLSYLPFEDSGGIPYSDKILKEYPVENSDEINIMYDERAEVSAEILKTISDASHIYFLGFGFAKENIQAIGLDKPILNSGQRIFATTLGMTDLEKDKIISNMRKTNPSLLYHSFVLEDYDSNMLLRKYM